MFKKQTVYKVAYSFHPKWFVLTLTQEVTCLDFHPFEQILASGSKDFSIRFFEYSKPSVKKAFRSVQVCFHVKLHGQINACNKQSF